MEGLASLMLFFSLNKKASENNFTMLSFKKIVEFARHSQGTFIIYDSQDEMKECKCAAGPKCNLAAYLCSEEGSGVHIVTVKGVRHSWA